MINSISGGGASAVAAASHVKAKDADGDNDGSKVAAKAANIGPAVIVSLSGAGQAKAPDMAQGDADHDGK